MQDPASRPSALTSPSLLLGLRRGDDAAWKRMVQLYTPLIYHWCRRSQLTREEAEDVTQEVFRTVSQSLDQFKTDRQESTFRGWLRTIFHSRMVDYLRRRAAGAGAQGGSEALARLHNLPEAELSESDPAVQALYHRVLQIIHSEFNDSAWRAFWMTVVEHRSSREVAEELDMTPGAVRQAKYRILRRVREEMGDVA